MLVTSPIGDDGDIKFGTHSLIILAMERVKRSSQESQMHVRIFLESMMDLRI